MIVSKIEEFKILLGWSPKCACTSIKSGILNSLGVEVQEGVHVDFLKKFPHYKSEESQEGYRKILIMRDPASRFVSTILNRCRAMFQMPYPYVTTRNMLSMLYDNNMVGYSPVTDPCYFSPDIRHHFKMQACPDDGIEIEWDSIYDIRDDLNRIFKKIRTPDMPEVSFSKMNSTNGSTDLGEEFYGDIPFAYLPETPSKNPKCWLDETMFDMLSELYKKDFDLIRLCDKV